VGERELARSLVEGFRDSPEVRRNATDHPHTVSFGEVECGIHPLRARKHERCTDGEARDREAEAVPVIQRGEEQHGMPGTQAARRNEACCGHGLTESERGALGGVRCAGRSRAEDDDARRAPLPAALVSG